MKISIDKCIKCGSKRIHYPKGDSSFMICMDCRTLHEIETTKCDRLSFYLWKREFAKCEESK